MNVRKISAALSIGVFSLGTFAACGDSEEAAAGSGDVQIGVSYPTANSPFWTAYNDFVNEGADQLGIKVNAVSADADEQKQLADVQNLISQGVDGLLLTPVSTSIAPTLLRAAQKADIPVVVTDRYPGYDPGENADADYVAFIGPNDVQAGQGIAESLAEAGAEKLIALGGVPGNSVTEGRKEGLDAGVEASGAELVQYQSAGGESEENGLSTAENMLQAHGSGNVDGVWCYNDNLCMGAIKAAQNAGRQDELAFGGMDLTPQAISAIKDGSYTFSYGGHWLQGGFGLAILFDKTNGEDPQEPVVKLDLLKVDESNVEEFEQKFIDTPPDYDFNELTGGGDIAYEITLD